MEGVLGQSRVLIIPVLVFAWLTPWISSSLRTSDPLSCFVGHLLCGTISLSFLRLDVQLLRCMCIAFIIQIVHVVCTTSRERERVLSKGLRANPYNLCEYI